MSTNAIKTRGLNLLRTAAAILLIGSGFALTETIAPAQEPAAEPAMGQMMKNQSAMMADRQKMMADMKAMDQKLNELVARMNAAQGPAKIDAVAAVVQELVAQHTRMRDRMMTMQGGMMDGMMSMMSMMRNAPPQKK